MNSKTPWRERPEFAEFREKYADTLVSIRPEHADALECFFRAIVVDQPNMNRSAAWSAELNLKIIPLVREWFFSHHNELPEDRADLIMALMKSLSFLCVAACQESTAGKGLVGMFQECAGMFNEDLKKAAIQYVENLLAFATEKDHELQSTDNQGTESIRQ